MNAEINFRVPEPPVPPGPGDDDDDTPPKLKA
jgi:hypothetical protein